MPTREYEGLVFMAKRKSTADRRFDRQRGCLLGLAVGDALGAAIEYSARCNALLCGHYPLKDVDFLDVDNGWTIGDNKMPGSIMTPDKVKRRSSPD